MKDRIKKKEIMVLLSKKKTEKYWNRSTLLWYSMSLSQRLENNSFHLKEPDLLL
jgi:hypothetical protein